MQDTTVDSFIDQFDDFPAETQERVMDGLRLVQRLAKRRSQRPTQTPTLNDTHFNIVTGINNAPETAEAHDARLDRQMAAQAAEAEGERPRLTFGASRKPR
jgi:hypothetical protein